MDLFRNKPELAVVLLRELGVAVPTGYEATLGSETLNYTMPTEFRCDAVVVLGDPKKPELAIVVEVQNQHKKEKQWSWPAYLATLRSRLECPVMLLVHCKDANVAQAYDEPIAMGHPGWDLRPIVLLESEVKPITEEAEARRLPELAVLSALGNSEGPEGVEVLTALVGALDVPRPEQAAIYTDYLRVRLPPVALRLLEKLMKMSPYQFESDFARHHIAQGEAKGRVEGRVEGEAKALLAILEARGLTVADAVRERIMSCTDEDTLGRWIERAVRVRSAGDLFD